MAIRNATSNFTFEQWRVEFNELAADVANISGGVTGSVPSGSSTHTTVESALEALVVDVNSIINGTHNFTGDVTFGANVSVTGNLTLGGNIVIGDQVTDTVSVDASLTSNLIPEASNAKDIGSSTKSWRNIYIGTEATLASAKVSDLTSGRVVLAGTSGEIQDDTNLTYSGTGTNFTLTVPKVSVATDATLATAKISDLTNGRVVLAGTSGELQDDTNLTYSGTGTNFTLTVPKISIGTDATLATAKVSDLTSGRIVIAGTSGELQDDSDLTFTGTTLTTTDLSVGSTATLASAKVSDLTTGRVVLAGTSGELETDSKFVFDKSGTGTFTANADTTISRGLTVNLATDLDSTLNVDGNTTLTANTGSTSTTSGTLVVTGGTGISQNLYVGGNIVSTGSISVAGGTPFTTEGFSIAIAVALG